MTIKKNVSAELCNYVNCQEREIEEQCGGKILFGAVGGSYSLGLQNRTSDVDVYLMLENLDFQGVKTVHHTFRVNESAVSGDFLCIDYHQALEELRNYLFKEKKYPTKFYYTDEEKKNYLEKKDMERPDFMRGMFYRIFLADELIGQKEAKKFLAEYGRKLKVKDIVDYQFSRVYGNYKEKIEGKRRVEIRKYLYCIHEVLTCKSLMESAKKPPMLFMDLLEKSKLDVGLNKILLDLYEWNLRAEVGKEHLCVTADDDLNRFICEQISEIICYLEENNEKDISIIL